jgi:predicted metalloprotease with PDZ domain
MLKRLQYAVVIAAALLVGPSAGDAQRPAVRYLLKVDSTDLSGWRVEMRIRNQRDTFSVAMARHPEYDDSYWRRVRDLTVENAAGPATIARASDAFWRVKAPRGETVVRYRISLPDTGALAFRGSWIPFLSPTGGLTGGPHAFMYVVGDTAAPAEVTLDLPKSWRVATALTSNAAAEVFQARSAYALVESPILAGHLREWSYSVNGIPHRVAFWPLPNAAPFDTATFVSSLESLSRESMALFGSAPYSAYTFLIQDGAYGGLEHPASVTLGVDSRTLAENPNAFLQDAAHEYLHAWNLMHIRPVEYRGIDYRHPDLSPSLWFSEGFTVYYADALLRRAGLPSDTATREGHLAIVAETYLGSAGAMHMSAEAVSRAEYFGGPASLGDYFSSPHLQGEVIATVLDFVIRDATGGEKSMDDVMRAMNRQFGGKRGFTGRDVERVIGTECACGVTAFFDNHIRFASPIQLGRYFALAGLSLETRRVPAVDRGGQPAPDLRIVTWDEPGAPFVRLRLLDPNSAWGRAGLHSGDQLVRFNGESVRSFREFRGKLAGIRIGDTSQLVIRRAGRQFVVRVPITGYQVTKVTVSKAPNPSRKALAIRERWLSGH